jgi:hypothetical protein
MLVNINSDNYILENSTNKRLKVANEYNDCLKEENGSDGRVGALFRSFVDMLRFMLHQ